MDVRALAPALLAVSDWLGAATAVVYGKQVKARIGVAGAAGTGCFDIDFTVLGKPSSRAGDFFVARAEPGDAAQAVLMRLGMGRGAGEGLLPVVQWVGEREIDQIDILPDCATLHVEGQTRKLELPVLALMRDPGVRQAAARMLEPLQHGVIDRLIATTQGVAHTISALDSAWFTAPPPAHAPILDETRKMVLSIISLAFKQANKWRLHDGTATIQASIADRPFLARVNANLISFAKGDTLICDVRVRQWQAPQGVKTDYAIERVREHRPPSRQISLPGL